MTTKNERQAHQLLAKTAGAAEVARMPDGTLAFCGRSGQLAEPLEYGCTSPHGHQWAFEATVYCVYCGATS